MKNFLLIVARVVLFIVNGIIAAIGLAGLIISIWALLRDQDFTDISGKKETFDSVPALMIFVSVAVMVLGGLGLTGAACGGNMCGRILIFVYSIITMLIVVLAVAGAIATAIEIDKIKDGFHSGANSTLYQTPFDPDYVDIWNRVQEDIHCCGVDKWQDWLSVNWTSTARNVVPVSCCSTSGGCGNNDYITQVEITLGVYTVYDRGCVSTVYMKLEDVEEPVIAIAVTIVLILVFAVILGLCVAIVSPDSSSYHEMV